MGVTTRTQCRVCNGTRLMQYLDLGMMPLVNQYRIDLAVPQDIYPLAVNLCEDCGLSQLTHVVEPELLYSDYDYRSSISRPFVEHCEALAHEIYLRYPSAGLVVDIASNDGVLVKPLLKKGFTAVGVEPARNLVDIATKDGCPTLHGFWNDEMAARVRGADVITALNVLAHVDDLDRFLHGVWAALKPGGIFIFEVPHAGDMLERLEFDTVYHEHLSYFTLPALNRALAARNLLLQSVEKFSMHGGTVRVTAKKIVGNYPKVDLLVSDIPLDLYEAVQPRLETLRKGLRKQVIEGWAGRKIAGFGAAAKGTVLINYCGIADQIAYVVDDTPEKQGRYIPGTEIPIFGREQLDHDPPDIILILAWNFADAILQSIPVALRDRAFIPYRCRSGGAVLPAGSGGHQLCAAAVSEVDSGTGPQMAGI